MFIGDHHVNTEGKSREQIIELHFKEWELRQAKEREDRLAAEAKLAQNKADVTEKKPAAPEKPAQRVDHFAGFKKFLRKMHL